MERREGSNTVEEEQKLEKRERVLLLMPESNGEGGCRTVTDLKLELITKPFIIFPPIQ